MHKYLRERQSTDRLSTVIGLALTVVAHAGAVCLVSFSGMKYIYPPPEDSSFLMEVVQDEETEIPKISKRGLEPKSEEIDKEKEVELVQRSESPHQSKRENLTPETKENGHGDVELPAVPKKEEPVLDARASFPGMQKKDTSLTAPHSASEASDTFKAGQATGNTEVGKIDSKANAYVEGRNFLGTLPKPAYNIQKDGVVVIKITVNQEGQVISANYQASGSTISSTELVSLARNAALKTKFNRKLDARAVQEGTITYKFTLK